MIAAPLVKLYRSPMFAWVRPGWRLSKRAFHASINSAFGGVPFRIGPVRVRIPSEYRREWTSRNRYAEDAAITKVIQWCSDHPQGRFIDVGADIGMYSLLVSSVLKGGAVVALDSSLPSLHVTARICARAEGDGRLKLVHGFVSDSGQGRTLEQAQRETVAELAKLADSGERVDPDYVVLGQEGTAEIPVNTLDELFGDVNRSIPTLIKIDIEGAEGKALSAAQRVLSRLRPHVLLSIHPTFLSESGSSKEAVLELVSRHNFTTYLLSVDHEEHWWCEPQ